MFSESERIRTLAGLRTRKVTLGTSLLLAVDYAGIEPSRHAVGGLSVFLKSTASLHELAAASASGKRTVATSLPALPRPARRDT